MTTKEYKAIADSIPHDPGIYQFIGADGEVLYVGKAKDLKKRVSSYFGDKKGRAYKTGVMVRSADRLKYTIVDTEQDALLLENSLIKELQPRFNVTWRDDKSYTYICIKKERFPRVFFTRNVIKDGSVYYGPYASKGKVKAIMDVVRKLFPLRTCKLDLAQKHIDSGKYKVCLEFHIKNCMGPCVGLESEEEYNAKIVQVRNVLKGNFKEVKDYLKGEMDKCVEELNFERAQFLKEKFDLFDEYQSRSTVVSQNVTHADVFAIATDKRRAYVHYLQIVHGALIYTYTMELVKNLNEDEEQLLALAIDHIREKFNSVAPEVILPYAVESESDTYEVRIPQRGERKALLDLAEKNVKHFLFEKQRQEINSNRRQSSAERILKTLQVDLNMDEVPWHIECFDNSNIQGSNPVASCVVFKNAKPSKQDYRKFNIRTVTGPDDYASMREVVRRRYVRLMTEQQPLPQLVIIDGGKGQLNAAMESILELGIEDRLTVIGIAKRLEEIYFPGDSVPLHINKKSESLKLIQQARNEAHRFAITFHRDKRSQKFTRSALVDIPGIGSKTARKLLLEFGSLRKLRQARHREISEVIGKYKATVVFEYLKAQAEEEE